MSYGQTRLRIGEPAGTRTQGPRLKRAMLYRLSYRLTEGIQNLVVNFLAFPQTVADKRRSILAFPPGK